MWTLVKALSPLLIIAILLFFIWIDTALGLEGPQNIPLGSLLVAFAIVLNSTCAWLLLQYGEGTPHPFTAQTKHLVVHGPYCFVRNPMMWGAGAGIIGLALFMGSAGLLFAFIFFFAFMMIWVPEYEEKELELRFGDEYRQYCEEVPRWWPTLHAYHSPYDVTHRHAH